MMLKFLAIASILAFIAAFSTGCANQGYGHGGGVGPNYSTGNGYKNWYFKNHAQKKYMRPR